MQSEARQKQKLVFLGNSFVGKTSIIERFVQNTFDPKSQPTVGIDFISKNMTIDGKTMRLLLWDTAGQERFYSLIPGYVRDAQCAVIVFDVTSRHSFESLDRWFKEVKQTRGNEALIVILGNKIDAERVVSLEEAKDYAMKKDILYYEVSAKTGKGIEEAMEQICLALPTDHSLLITQSQVNQSQFEQQTVPSNRRPVHLDQNGFKQLQKPSATKNNQCCAKSQ
ncbi:unnamed protein product [Paramecium sonneborni]|uniref:Uncharacterized protein n=1 Tax=Paramecium sonneborni TaxID=65129 RepID=A0A8S1N1Q6_9CILI|nr:unnamed protein product [Paramecium sonneborni]